MKPHLIVLAVLAAIALVVFLTFLMLKRPKTACIYAYYEKDAVYKENLRFFLEKGLDVPNMDYYLVINGKCTLSIPPNVTVLNRENNGYDFGAWCHAIARYPMEKYDYVFFVNTSVRGPYSRDKNWTKAFIKRFKGDTKLVGTSINIGHPVVAQGTPLEGTAPVYPHVQSMFFCLNREGLAFLREQGFFDAASLEGKGFREVITEKEIGMSLMILNHGWNIDSVLSKYQGLDYRRVKSDINHTSVSGDPYFNGAYFGGTISPEEAVFFKIARFAYS